MSYTRKSYGNVSEPSRFKSLLEHDTQCLARRPKIPETQHYKRPGCREPKPGYDIVDNANLPRNMRRTYHCSSCLQAWRDARAASEQNRKLLVHGASVKSDTSIATPCHLLGMIGSTIGTAVKCTPTVLRMSSQNGGNVEPLSPSHLSRCFS